MSEHHHMHHDHMDHSGHDMTGNSHDMPGNSHHDMSGMDHVTTDHSQHAASSMMHNMGSMAFHFGYNEKILFEFWTISSVGGLVGSMIGIFFLAALYEGLKYYREYLFWKTYNSLQYRSVDTPINKNPVPEDNAVVQPSMLSVNHSVQTLLHIVQIVTSYFLMLIFMTYNTWLCVAVTLGAATGYFLFGWKKSVIIDVTEHCH